MIHEHTLSILVRNKAGVLTKIAGVFYRRGYNISTLTVGKMHTPDVSKILISVPVDDRDVELLRRQIENFVNVQQVRLLDRTQSIMLEVCLTRVGYRSPEERREIMTSANPYRPRLVAIDDTSITLMITESPIVVNDFVGIMSKHEILDVSRTGMTAMGPEMPPIERETQASIPGAF
jgi:acetolactate synthase I/III small subunit